MKKINKDIEKDEMDLFHILLNIDQFSEEETIYVEHPWTLESEAQVIYIKDKATSTIHLENKVYAYFLDIYLVDELLAQFANQNLCLRTVYQRIVEFSLDQHT